MDDADDDGNAAELQFGKEFSDDVQFLMNDEVHILLERNRKVNEQLGHTNDTFNKTHKYTQKLAATSDTDSLRNAASELRGGLSSSELVQKIDGKMARLHEFEVAQLANLAPYNCEVEEALAWIPSLSRFEEESIQQVLELIYRVKSRIHTGF
mmetsp:Transcript_429/g.815  ORF Transcript_429/g.815 Transcript_429/m.815 type:complete len:153 (-) Transcript_429:208-666(-)|eukprot:CAMPEP_0185018050 /NCGR_PEP_ID=MMETSP1103-20130426/904_1 /TAXON_ID=36769 /ORGANISM="Paraphysomonas bandaiensis, Strain Caron Lab Isolate" /LENGTH=152 /DNA_ID=CAMNT_0027547739 /DNA_START=31 /DNA_END=489 /DNA_ORIENTATION=+